MGERTEYKPGEFCWTDVQTTDQEAAKAFYSDLFGWDTEEMPTDGGPVYTMCRLGGKDVCAISPLPAEQQQMGIPPHWNSYISVASANDAVEKAKSLGANVLMEAFDVMDAGRMAVLQDPTGAVFLVWEPKATVGAEIVNEPCTVVWNELMTRDTKAAQSFYTQLFDWTANNDPVPGAGMEYTILEVDGHGRGGLMAMPAEVPAEAPPGWMVYFAVDDVDGATEKARSLGATIFRDPTDIPEVGRFAVIQDPTGAVFSIIKMVSTPPPAGAS